MGATKNPGLVGKIKLQAQKMPEVLVRILSAVFLIPFVIFLIMEGGYAFKGLLAVLVFLMAREYEVLTTLPKKSRGIFTAGVFATAFWVLTTTSEIAMVHGGMMAAVIGYAVFQMALILNKPQLKWCGIGIAYICIPVFALGFIEISTGPYWIFWTLLVVWGCDTGGYSIGKWLGGPKLAPRISPNKTWAGFIGGTLLGTGLGTLGAWLMDLGSLITLGLLAALLAVWGQIGDLVESSIKRIFRTKDSGNLIPGHGGVLDRVDALIFVAPVVAFTLYLVN